MTANAARTTQVPTWEWRRAGAAHAQRQQRPDHHGDREDHHHRGQHRHQHQQWHPPPASADGCRAVGSGDPVDRVGQQHAEQGWQRDEQRHRQLHRFQQGEVQTVLVDEHRADQGARRQPDGGGADQGRTTSHGATAM